MHSWEGDPRPEPVPEYGTIRPGMTVKLDHSIDPQSGSWRILFAVAAGILLAALFATGNARAAFDEISRFLTLQGKPEAASPAVLSQHEIEKLDRETPQQQAEILLERAVNQYEGANDQIAVRVESWWGKLKFTPRFNSLITLRSIPTTYGCGRRESSWTWRPWAPLSLRLRSSIWRGRRPTDRVRNGYGRFGNSVFWATAGSSRNV